MCGIAAYYGYRNALPILLKKLKILEYRGYDSCGLSLYRDKIYSEKVVGKVDELIKKSRYLEKLNATIGIAHTRWATHGRVEEINTHPIFDCNEEIAVIHNGIIENFESLKRFLIERGHRFKSQTDTEVIPHLFEEMLKNKNAKEAWKNTIASLEGAFAIVALYKGNLFLARRSSPLIIGFNKNKTEFFIASDVLALSSYTKNFIALDDNEIAYIIDHKLVVENLKGEKIEKEISEIKELEEEISREGYETFMLKEIKEQPTTIENAFKGRIAFKDVIPVFGGFKFEDIKNLKRIIMFGCGSSYNAGVYAKYLFDRFFDCHVEYASELRYKEKEIRKDDLLIAISQSGETIDVLECLKKYKEKAMKSLGIVNVVSSSIAREVDGGIYLHSGREIGVAATKTYTSQLVVLFLLWLYLSRKFGYIKEKEGKKYLNELTTIPKKIKHIFESENYIRRIARKYANYNNALVLARKYEYANALEGALKLKEIAYIHAEAMSSGEMKHGPIALVDKNMFSIFIVPHTSVVEKVINNMEEIKARDGKILSVTTKGKYLKQITKNSDDVIIVPYAIEELQPILTIIPLQLLTYYIARTKNIDVDKPRNLAKTVTVE
jgi:glucosamine--fructose-6-phosphate aminotransferase (isomerizing)